ncbi:plastocyanin [Polaromonas sp. SM01]|uniref:cupredoxin domain-containing protein n=1 Tax=Polaromonas sp. SM01 TaxID=3085630 RepID=UPI00298164C6|nr:plastocyanin [Polaromonas sp. SM01]MDW5443605.1 plastocyanin [Polaromonas sp. SM01]
MKKTLLTLALAALSGWATAGNLQVLVLDKEGKPVADAVVVVLPANKGEPKTALPTQVTINQEKMRFIPAVSVVAVGARAHFTNNDPWDHHVRGSAAGFAQFNTAASGGFELRLDGKVDGKPAKSADAVFEKAGAVLLGCHIHGSMRGHVYVSESPWAMLTGADGIASIEQIPDGAAQIKVWHADQLIDIAPQPTTVSATPGKATMQLSVVPRRRRI